MPHDVRVTFTGLRPIYGIFFEFLPISFQRKNIYMIRGFDSNINKVSKSQILPKRKQIYPLRYARAMPFTMGQN